jgi:hypothetical protein
MPVSGWKQIHGIHDRVVLTARLADLPDFFGPIVTGE